MFKIDDNIKLLNSLVNAASMSETDLDNFCYNWGITRLGGTYSVTTVTFQATTLPTSDIQIGNSDGSGGIVIKTRSAGGSTLLFTTTQTGYLRTTAVKNPNTGFYEVTVNVIANAIGLLYNVAANTIVLFNSPITGIDSLQIYYLQLEVLIKNQIQL